MGSLSFKYKFILTFVLVEIFFILLIVGVNFFSINNTTKKLITKEIVTTKHLLNSLVKLPISVYDLATLDDIATQSTLGSLNSILIFDSNNHLLSQNYNINSDSKLVYKVKVNEPLEVIENQNKYTIHRTNIMEDDILIGSLILVFDLNEITEDINKNKQNTFIIILLEILISSLIAYFLGNNLTKRLSNLTDIARKIGKEEEFEIKFEKETNEISILNNSLAKMYEDINFRNEKLKEAKIVFDNITEAIIILDETKIALSVNDSFYAITKYKFDEIKDKNFFDLLNIQLDEINLFKNNDFKQEFKINRKDNKELIILLNINILKDENGQIKNYIVLFVDITKEKRKEEMLQIQSKMATMGEMLGNIAHQWRQPLSAISTIASTTQIQNEMDLLDKSELSNSLSIIIKSTRFLSETIEDFRNFFKTDKTIEKFEIDEIFESLDKIILSTYSHHNIEIKINKSHDKIFIEGLKNELLQSLLNILNNAKDILIEKDIKNKTIEINISENDETVTITIEDNAGGIPEKLLPKIFEPYFTTKHQSQGTGIGLYMTHTIITQHYKGKLTATNSNKGALFTIEIPKNLTKN